MNILINALSVTNLSGRHVLLGYLSRMAQRTAGSHQYYVLFHPGNRDLKRDLGGNVHWHEVSPRASHWLGRAIWERSQLPQYLVRHQIHWLFSPAGTVVPNVSVPQIAYAQNPWCLVPEVPRKPLEQVKAALQRKAYRQAMRVARWMVFNSQYMRRAYRDNAGYSEKQSAIVYPAIADETHLAAAQWRGTVARKPWQVLSVSVMAPHKGVETVVSAVARLRQQGLPVELLLVGSWPDAAYELRIRQMVAAFRLEPFVTFKGHVSQDELHRHYAESRVFCLMSWCESFGIPAVEGQAFGTPVVSSNACAIPEVCGAGGVYPQPGDVAAVARSLEELLTSQKAWQELSLAAVQNAAKYQWDLCAQPMVQLFQQLASTMR